MNVVICKPSDNYLFSKNGKGEAFNELQSFYNLLEEILQENNIKYKIQIVTLMGKVERPNTLCIAYHTYNNLPNIWTVKRGYLPGYLYFDKYGYSGWAENNYDPSISYSYKQLDSVLDITEYYINNNISKERQPEQARLPANPYILVLNQKASDTVSRLAHIQTQQLSAFVNQVYAKSQYEVYTKMHPKSPRNSVTGKTITGSLHKLIANAKKIYTVNSGAGFEALLHLKHVYTSGASEYTPVTTVVETYKDIVNTKDNIGPTEDEILHYLYYALNEHFVNAFNKKSIEKSYSGQ